MQTSLMDTRVSHLVNGGWDDPLPIETRGQVRALLLRRNDCPEDEIEDIDRQILRLVRPYRRDGILDLAAEQFGRRHKITRREMREFLSRLDAEGFVDLADEWPIAADDGDLATAWARACRDITVISLIDYGRDRGAPSSSNQGAIRYDQPGSMEPMLRATLMFAPAELAELPYDQLGQLRPKTRRLLIVADG